MAYVIRVNLKGESWGGKVAQRLLVTFGPLLRVRSDCADARQKSMRCCQKAPKNLGLLDYVGHHGGLGRSLGTHPRPWAQTIVYFRDPVRAWCIVETRYRVSKHAQAVVPNPLRIHQQKHENMSMDEVVVWTPSLVSRRIWTPSLVSRRSCDEFGLLPWTPSLAFIIYLA